MNALDILLIILALLAFLRSLFRGLVREAAAIAALVAGVLLASHNYGWLAGHLPWVSGAVASAVAFILIMVLTYLVFALAAFLLRGALKIALLRWLDRALGGVLGAFEGLVIAGIIVMALVALLPERPNILVHSKLAPRLYPVADGVAAMVPAELRHVYQDKKAKLLAPEKKETQRVEKKEGAKPRRTSKAGKK